jgi:hypothetical protein
VLDKRFCVLNITSDILFQHKPFNTFLFSAISYVVSASFCRLTFPLCVCFLGLFLETLTGTRQGDERRSRDVTGEKGQEQVRNL